MSIEAPRATGSGEGASGPAATAFGAVERAAVLIGSGLARPATGAPPAEAEEACRRLNAVLESGDWGGWRASASAGGPVAA